MNKEEKAIFREIEKLSRIVPPTELNEIPFAGPWQSMKKGGKQNVRILA